MTPSLRQVARVHRRNAQRAHAKRRALERFGLRLSDCALDEIRRLIECGELELVVARPNGRTLWRMPVDSDARRTCLVVWDRMTRAVVTFLHDRPPLKRRRRRPFVAAEAIAP